MAEKIEAIARRLYDHFNSRNFDALAQVAADDVTVNIAGSADVLRGREGLRQYVTMWATAFPDAQVMVDRVLVSGSTVTVELTGHGTHTGPLTGPAGTIASTGKSITVTACEIHDYRDGRLTSLRAYVDMAGLLTQLGVMPAPARATR